MIVADWKVAVPGVDSVLVNDLGADPLLTFISVLIALNVLGGAIAAELDKVILKVLAMAHNHALLRLFLDRRGNG